MNRTLAAELAANVGSQVRLAGWLHRRRELKSVTFLILRDRSGLAQVVLAGAGDFPDFGEETPIEVIGECVSNPQAPGGVEVHHPTVRALSEPAEAPPVELFRPTIRASLPTILDHAPVTLRHPRLRAPFLIAAASVAGFRSALDGLGFTEVHSPKIVGSATEGGAAVFTVDYFGRDAYLAQSPQFYKQTLVGVFERVYEVGPVFRAEPHNTARHLAEYVSLDAELGFIESYADVMSVLREAIAGMTERVARDAAGAVALIGTRLPLVPPEIPSIHFADAQAMISAATGEDLAGVCDLEPAHERWLGEWAEREHGAEFLFVTAYPMAKRPFYTHPDPARPEFSNSFDLLFRGLELVTGGQRLHRYSDYVAALGRIGQVPESYESYLEAFRHGMPPHGGFAIGLERWVARLTGAKNIRETTLFPRDLHRLTP